MSLLFFKLSIGYLSPNAFLSNSVSFPTNAFTNLLHNISATNSTCIHHLALSVPHQTHTYSAFPKQNIQPQALALSPSQVQRPGTVCPFLSARSLWPTLSKSTLRHTCSQASNSPFPHFPFLVACSCLCTSVCLCACKVRIHESNVYECVNERALNSSAVTRSSAL